MLKHIVKSACSFFSQEFPFEPKNIDFHKVPQCLISTLEYVQIEELILKEKSGIKLVDYFLENSAVLKKLTLSFTYHSKKKQDPESYKKLLTSTKLSPTCQIIIDWRAADDAGEHMSVFHWTLAYELSVLMKNRC